MHCLTDSLGVIIPFALCMQGLGFPATYTCSHNVALCMQDSDRLWRLTPPAQKALAALLDDSSAAMSFSWSVLRNAPPLSPHGSPMCEATQTFQLAPKTRTELVDILEVC